MAQMTEQWVIRGNHHDAWVNGADDPISGQAAMLEEARMLVSCIVKDGLRNAPSFIARGMERSPAYWGRSNGWKPMSTELKKHAVAYINSDSNESGYLFRREAHKICRVSSAAWPATSRIRRPTCRSFSARILSALQKRKMQRSARKFAGAAIWWSPRSGDGSDYTAFQDFAGISTLDIGFGGEEDGDQYHSIYDDFYWYTHFMDTDFVYGRALAQTGGTAIMRLADADLIPFDYSLRKLQRSRSMKRNWKSCSRTNRTNSPNAICN